MCGYRQVGKAENMGYRKGDATGYYLSMILQKNWPVLLPQPSQGGRISTTYARAILRDITPKYQTTLTENLL
jgi:hypothetical protein